jgi:hypothetical protein
MRPHSRFAASDCLGREKRKQMAHGIMHAMLLHEARRAGWGTWRASPMPRALLNAALGNMLAARAGAQPCRSM